jgi:predicted 3-demethylubiquinone-9 3-methyltransferase (glyoxalase superfamily)
MQKITTFLTFNDQAEEAMKFYTSIFRGAKVVSTTRYGDAGPGPKGSLMTGTFTVDGQQFIVLNGGPSFTFSQGISLFVSCETQAEVDELWEKLSAGGGEKGPCGWLTDKFGVAWQVVPTVLLQLLNDKDPERSKRAMNAMMKMTKIEISEIQRAADGK